MTNLKMKDGELSASFSFPVDFIGFKGHFPSLSVLPGMCMIQAFLVMYASQINQDVCLRKILTAKFTGIISADQPCHVSLTETAGKNAGEYRLTGSIYRQGEQVARVKLLVCREVEDAT